MKRALAAASAALLGCMALGLCGCQGDDNAMTKAPRAEQEKAFMGDPSKAPDSVKAMMKNPPTNARPQNPSGAPAGR